MCSPAPLHFPLTAPITHCRFTLIQEKTAALRPSPCTTRSLKVVHTLSISAWKRRSGSSLAFACNTVWSRRTFSDPGRLSPVVIPFSPFRIALEPGLLPSAGITRHPRYYKPLRHPAGPACPSRGSGWCVRTTDRASRVATIPLFHACRRHYPGGTGRCSRRSLPVRWQPSPKNRRVGFRITRFEACSAFTRVAARMVAESPKATRYIGVLQAMSLPPSPAPIATGWSDSCRAGFAPAGERRLSTAHYFFKCLPDRNTTRRTERLDNISVWAIKDSHKDFETLVLLADKNKWQPHFPFLNESTLEYNAWNTRNVL